MPSIDAATEFPKISNKFSSLAIFLIFLRSVSFRFGFSLSRLIDCIPVAIKHVAVIALLLALLLFALKTPVIYTLSPGLALSTKSFSRTTSMLLGSCPVGALSGISWIVKV